QVRTSRIGHGVTPFVKQIDTLAAEYPAQTNYLYCTYHGMEDDVGDGEGGVMVLGSGTYRIGSSVEFDWCGVSAIRALRAMGQRSTMVNYNPETVSTDYDECDQLYFEELSRERVMDIYQKEKHSGVVVSIPNNLAVPLSEAGAQILGTSPTMIDTAEDRNKFSAMIDEIGLQQPAWKELTTVNSALGFATQVGYPVMVRASYILSGAAMNVAYNKEQLLRCLHQAADVSKDHPVVVSKFIHGAKEIEMDGVGHNGEVIAAATHIHVENAGVHSGDATLLLPPPAEDMSPYMFHRVQQEATEAIAKRLNITGPFNIQFIAKGTDCMVIECNLRASRSCPFVSKTMGVDFVEVATKAMCDSSYEDMNAPKLYDTGRPQGYVGCKAPMFSFTRLRGADPVLGVEMSSTGEVACFGANKEEAFLKALLSTGFKIPEKNILLSVQHSMFDDIVHVGHDLHKLGYNLFATELTHDYLEDKGVPSTLVRFPSAQGTAPNVVDHLREKKIDLVINLPTHESKMLEDNYAIRRTAVDFGIPLLTNLPLVKLFTGAVTMHKKKELVGLTPDSLFDYYSREKPEEAWWVI
ncbi:unnamed protein product, partial [Choristocarpus tenellus]